MLYGSDIRSKRSIATDLGTDPFEFDMLGFDPDDSWFSIGPSVDTTIIARDYSGGVFVIYDAVDDAGPLGSGIFHISSEAQASRIGSSLKDALEHILAIPAWIDAAHEDVSTMRARVLESERELDDMFPQWRSVRNRVGESLGLNVHGDFTDRLHATLASGLEIPVLVNGQPTINGFQTNWDELGA